MNEEAMKIVFMGTPEFAVESLKVLVEGDYNVVGVITAPDKPAGRGRKMKESAVKIYAKENGLPILQPRNLKQPIFFVKCLKLTIRASRCWLLGVRPMCTRSFKFDGI